MSAAIYAPTPELLNRERGKAESELEGSKLKKGSESDYSLKELKAILTVLPETFTVYKKTDLIIRYIEGTSQFNDEHSLENLYQISKYLELLPDSSTLLEKTKHLIEERSKTEQLKVRPFPPYKQYQLENKSSRAAKVKLTPLGPHSQSDKERNKAAKLKATPVTPYDQHQLEKERSKAVKRKRQALWEREGIEVETTEALKRRQLDRERMKELRERRKREALEQYEWERESLEAVELPQCERETREDLELPERELELLEKEKAAELKEAASTEPGSTSTPKAPANEEQEIELERQPSKEDRLKRQRREASKLLRMEREKREASELVERKKREALELREREKREESERWERERREKWEASDLYQWQRQIREDLELQEGQRRKASELHQLERERRKKAAKLKGPASTEPGTTSTPKAPANEEQEIQLKKSKLKKKPNLGLHGELKKSKLKKEQSWAPYSLEDLKEILILLPEDSKLFEKTDRHIKYKERSEAANELKKSKLKKIPAKLQYSLDDLCQILKFLEQEFPQSSELLVKTKNRISCIEGRIEAAKLKVPPFTKPGPSSAHYSLYELKAILLVLPEDSKLYKKTDRLIKYTQHFKLPAKLYYSLEDLYQISKFLGQVLRQDSKLLNKTKHLIQKLKERCYFSDLTEEQLMSSFREVRKFRFVLCKVFLSYNSLDAKAREVVKYRRDRRSYGPLMNFYSYDLPNDTAHGTVVCSHQLFGSIQAAGFSLDPASPPFDILNRQFNDPIPVPKLGCLSPDCICYCSIPFSTSVKIAAQLYVTTDETDDMNTIDDYYSRFRGAPEQFNEAFEICNDSAVINLSDYFANRPNGGSCSYTLTGRDGYLKLYYVALKYVVDAALEVVFHATSKKTKVAGRVMAYFGKHFDYGCSPAEVDDYKAMLFESKQPEVKPGKINLMRSLLSVPAQFSLIIDANLTDSTSGDIILSGVYEFFVPTDGGITDGCIMGNDCSLELTVDWKLPPFSEETTLAERSYYSDLTEKQVFPQSSSVTKDEEDGRWSLQKEFSLAFDRPVNGSFPNFPREVSVSISTDTEADNCDYLCTSVLNIWPEIRSCSGIDGPKLAGLAIKDAIDDLPQAGMLERCVVGGPGFLKFKLSRSWIAESIFKMLELGIDTRAPELSIETAIIHILPRNIAKEMHMGHLQSAIIGDALANVLEYSGVRVRRRSQYGDYLDIESKMMMTEFLIDSIPNWEVNNQAIGELEVLFENSKKRFAQVAEFRERTQPVQDWDDRHKNAWEQICKISQECYREVYQRLRVRVKEEVETLHDHYIGETRRLLREKGYNTEVEGDEVIVIEGRKLRLVDFAALWHSLEIEKPDRIVHVADVGQRDKIEICITAAESVGGNVTNHCHDPLSHVGFVQVKGVEGFGLVQLLDEAKSRCKAILVGKAGKELEDKLKDELEDKLKDELERTAEAFGCGAVKYEVLKNNRLTDYTFSFDEMFKETGNTAVYLQKTHARICSNRKWKNIFELAKKFFAQEDVVTLKDDRERQLGLHLLRYTEVVGEVCRVLAPHILCDYLFVLCYKFNGLYSDSGQVVWSDKEDSKILLYEATRVVLEYGLLLLGITPIYPQVLNKWKKRTGK